MEKRFYNPKVIAQFTLFYDEENLPDLNINGNFLKFIWNKGDDNVLIELDNQEQILYPNQIICTTYLQNIRISNNQNQVVVLLFNREFYCVHTYDSEVSCNGLLFFGSNQTPIILLNQNEVQVLTYLISVLKDEFDIVDGNREEMLRILLKRFIIRCTRLAKQQLFKGDISINEVDIVRLFNVLVEENYKKMKKIVLLFLTASTFFACKTNEVKTETAASASGTVTTTGPDVDLIKKSITAWADGDWATYASTYADTAKSTHNAWPSATDSTVTVKIPALIEGFKKQRELMDGNVTMGNSIIEVVTMPDGNKYGHVWVELSWKSHTNRHKLLSNKVPL